jgi:uncharacterized lipoprotein
MVIKVLQSILVGASALLLSACATTTHYINLDPSIEIKQANLTNSNIIQVTVNSQLDSKIGVIDTAINEHADIYVSNAIEDGIQSKVIQGLTSLGYQLDKGNLPASQLSIDVTELSYTTTTKALKTIATLKVNLKATLKSKNQTYTANYGSEVVDEYGSLPDREDVEVAMNNLAGQTVNRLLNDSNIRILLK